MSLTTTFDNFFIKEFYDDDDDEQVTRISGMSDVSDEDAREDPCEDVRNKSCVPCL